MLLINTSLMLFQSTPSWRGRPTAWQTPPKSFTFQSTPSWRGRLRKASCQSASRPFQSTPSWRGRHRELQRIKSSTEISIHALMKRATVGTNVKYAIGIISIHALMKRATWRECTNDSLWRHFNPRPHEEGDHTRRLGGVKHINFNPRPHEEGDFF